MRVISIRSAFTVLGKLRLDLCGDFHLPRTLRKWAAQRSITIRFMLSPGRKPLKNPPCAEDSPSRTGALVSRLRRWQWSLADHALKNWHGCWFQAINHSSAAARRAWMLRRQPSNRSRANDESSPPWGTHRCREFLGAQRLSKHAGAARVSAPALHGQPRSRRRSRGGRWLRLTGSISPRSADEREFTRGSHQRRIVNVNFVGGRDFAEGSRDFSAGTLLNRN